MVIAMITVEMVQPSLVQIVGVIAVRNGFMTLAPLRPTRACNGGTARRIGFADGNHMLVVVPIVGTVHVALVEIPDVPLMSNPSVAATLSVDVIVIRVGFVFHAYLHIA